jgi:hypothetical protein
MRIKTQSEFEAWLDSNFWLQDVLINALEPHPKTVSENSEPPKCVKLICALQVGGSYQAGETRWVRNIEIIAQDVRSYFIDWEEGFVVENCCQGIELMEVEHGLSFTLDVPGTLQIACASLDILQHPDKEETVQPWFSSTDFSAYAVLQRLPTPEDWINHFQKQGWDVVWRYYYSDEQALERVPANYTGWFLQLRSRLDENSQGLFFKHCQLEGEQFSLSLYNYDPVLEGLWVEAGKYIAVFPEVSISCGNTIMNPKEWLAYLAQFDT